MSFVPPIFAPRIFGGMRIVSDPNALEKTTERLFPESRHRSRRIHKKLVRRFGGEFMMQPVMFRIGQDTIVCHPAVYEKVKATMEEK